MKIEIKHKISGSILFSLGTTSLKLALEAAVKSNTNLRGANLWDANLGGVQISPETRLDTGETFKQYLEEVVPQLLTAGGKTVKEIVKSKAWDCHEWSNCPMAFAFGIKDTSEAPILLRPRVAQFIKLFDAKLIPEPVCK